MKADSFTAPYPPPSFITWTKTLIHLSVFWGGIIIFWCPAIFYNFPVHNTHFVKQFLTLTHNCIMAIINNGRFLILALASGYYSSLSIIIPISPSVSFPCCHTNLFNILLCSQFSRKAFAFAVNKSLFAARAAKKAGNSSLSLSVVLRLHQSTLPTMPMNSNRLNKEQSFAFSFVKYLNFLLFCWVEHK